MKSTGIVRRIDDLGRIVIPKEIRRHCKIRENDPMEIYVDKDGTVILKKYSPVKELGEFAKQYADALYEAIGHAVLITDCDNVIAVAGAPMRLFLNKEIGQTTDSVIDSKESVIVDKPDIVITEVALATVGAFAPIIMGQTGIGAVVIFSKNPETKMGDMEIKLAQTAAGFLAKQMTV